MMFRTKTLLLRGLLLGAFLMVTARASAQGYDAPPVPLAPAPAPQGQWVNTAQYGLIWVPAAANVVDVGGVPSVYLYTPAYGWSWYASPWGYGAFAYGPWVQGPWPYGFRVWRRSQYGWGWHGPHVNVYVGPRPFYGPRHYDYGPRHHYYGPRHHRYHGYRGHGHHHHH